MKTKNFIQRLAISSILLMACFCYNPIIAQVAINTDGTPPDGSAMLDVQSTEKGFLPPRMTEAQISFIANPADGLMVYNTDEGKIYVYVAGESLWKELPFGTETVIPVIYTIGSGGYCNNTVAYGTFKTGIALDGSNTLNIDVNVITPGAWSINTNTVNGYSFSGSGTFTTMGVNTVSLVGSGTPITVQTDSFTATADAAGGNSTCTFEITVTPGIWACGDTFVDDRDSQTYTTVQIGTQCWMSENMNYITTNSWWYSNSDANGDVYGRLYEYYAAHTACPVGWHLPTVAEWTALANNLGGQYVAGGKLKEEDYDHWNLPNYGATNSSGFTALPGGLRWYYDGNFYSLGDNGYWWSATGIDAFDAWSRCLDKDVSSFYSWDSRKSNGFSVRCVRD